MSDISNISVKMLVNAKRNFLLGVREKGSLSSWFIGGVWPQHKEETWNAIARCSSGGSDRELEITDKMLASQSISMGIKKKYLCFFCLIFLVCFETCSWGLNYMMLFGCCLPLLLQIPSGLMAMFEWGNCSYSSMYQIGITLKWWQYRI